ncbi:MAG TPA: DedA family protein [Candidatus Dormibacteraeota bacterium]|jgi:membrane protein DedA with SNARE-associated domain|nr:DedA family protein [Candidatus Dormibacteraeota bacterium]
MLALALTLSDNLPGWLQEPSWWQPLTHAVREFVQQHPSGGLFLVIFLEELGVPLPAPGDVAIMYGGYLTTTGAIPYPLAYLAVVSGAVLGSACNLTISRKYGRPFIQRFGRYVGVTEERLVRAERLFKRWGPWAIILGRHIPGMRIVLSALSGILEVPYRVFVPCVFISAIFWAAIFLEIGRHVGPRIREVFQLFPAHLIPWALLGLGLLVIGYLGYEHGFKPKAWNRHAEEHR